MWANDIELVRKLIESGANVNARNRLGQTALMLNQNHPDITFELIKSGADIYLRDNEQKTALEYIHNVDTLRPCVEYLIKYFLWQVFAYFRLTHSLSIQADVQTFVESKKTTATTDDDTFAMKSYHVFALRVLANLTNSDENGNDGFCEPHLLSTFSFLPFFISSDFQLKLLGDVVNRLAENNVCMHGQRLVAMKKRASKGNKNQRAKELEEIERALARASAKRLLANEFCRLVNELKPRIMKMANKLFGTNMESSLSDEFDEHLDKYLEKTPHILK